VSSVAYCRAWMTGDIPHRSSIMIPDIHSVYIQVHQEVVMCFLVLSFIAGRKPVKWRHWIDSSSRGLS